MRVLHLAALALLTGAPAAAQQVQLSGRVIEAESETPIPGADVYFRTPQDRYIGRTRTDAAGRFLMLVRNTEGVKIRADRFGFRQNLTPVLYFDGRAAYAIELRLAADAVLLAPLEVTGRSEVGPSHFLDAFRYRVKHGNGVYITRADIARAHPGYVTDLLRTVPGLEVVGSGAGSRPVVRTPRGAGRNCATLVFVDGMLLNRRTADDAGADAFRIDDVVAPDVVEGIEVYAGLSTVPPEFLSVEAACGVVAIWTRRGDT